MQKNNIISECRIERERESNSPLVSVLTPCYNSKNFIAKLLGAVLKQDYPNIEMIVVDDGSTDDSAKIIQSFIPKFAKKGFSLKYFYQKNQGQSAAINYGLKKVKGDFLVWPDSDDYYSSPTTISKMAKILIEKPDFSCARVLYKYKDATTGKFFKKFVPQAKYKTNLLEDALINTNQFWYPPGGFMGRMEIFDKYFPTREIWTNKKAGQNYQLYLPFLAGGKCYTICEFLYVVVERPDSHSRGNNWLKMKKLYWLAAKKTLKKMHLKKDYEKYLLKINWQAYGIWFEKSKTFRRKLRKICLAIVPYGIIWIYRRKIK